METTVEDVFSGKFSEETKVILFMGGFLQRIFPIGELCLVGEFVRTKDGTFSVARERIKVSRIIGADANL